MLVSLPINISAKNYPVINFGNCISHTAEVKIVDCIVK